MKASYTEIMDKLAVGRPLNVYETQPWLAYNDDQTITCEAEVHCNHDKSELTAAVQFMYDNPKEGQRPVDQVVTITVQQQAVLNNNYTVTSCLIKDKEWKGDFYDWETQACSLFRACVKELRNHRIPDMDKLIAEHMKESSIYKKGRGDGSNKSPKINASQLMYDRKGIGAGF